jgi:cytochrome c oxidase cbb3-type subunit 2
MIANAPADAVAQASPDGDTQGLMKRYGAATQVRLFDGDKRTLSEMDALVAYLQVLGKLSNAAQAPGPAGK